MAEIRNVDPKQLHRAFLEAFADYALDASETTEEQLLLRMKKNAVDYRVSPGAYDDDGRLVGFTLIGVDMWGGCPTAYDAGTGLVPAFRSQGLAKRLLDHALPPLRERHVARFVLEVLQQNEPAIKAYRKSGFEVAREFACFAAPVEKLRSPRDHSGLEVRAIDRATFARLEPAADWLPSFENRFSAIDAIPEHIELTGAFDGSECLGVTAYSPSLRWLLTILVLCSHRRRGVGTALVRHLAASLPESVTRLAALNVDGTDTGTCAFLESLGFARFVDQYEMRRSL